MSALNDQPLVAAAIEAIHNGNQDLLRQVLNEDANLTRIRIDGNRTLLHVAADWPGHFPNGSAIVRTLVTHGADVNAKCIGQHSETPLHWAASSNDVDVLDALLDNGANIEATGAVIGGGTALADAVAFGQWQAAKRLVERGAQTTLWQAAALGLIDRVKERFAKQRLPEQSEITNAFWNACHGGQQETAEYLLAQGADLNWIGYEGESPLDAAQRAGVATLAAWLRDRGGQSAKQVKNRRLS